MREARKIKPARNSTRDANLALGMQHHAAGRFGDAETIYQRLYTADRRDSEAIFLLGMLCCDLGLFEAARRFLGEALAITPKFPEAQAQLAIAANGLAELKLAEGELCEARSLLEEALEAAPRDARTLENLGRVELMRGDAAAAEKRLMTSLVQRPSNAQALNWLGLARHQLGKYFAAEPPLRQALSLQPDLMQARNNLGLVLHQLGRLPEAKLCFETALTKSPDYHNARVNLANTLRILGEPESAQRELETALSSQPDAIDALNNLGAVFQDMGKVELALGTLQRALELSPGSPQTRWNLALTQLQLGDFANGWENFEARWEGSDSLRGGYQMPKQRAWRGQSLQGKRLLLWFEQGFGDTIQFIRFAQDAALRGAIVTAIVQQPLANLLRSVPGVSNVTTPEKPLPAYDFHCPLMSMPYRLDISANVTELRGNVPYLFAEKHRIDAWHSRLKVHSGLKVGVAWAGAARGHSAQLAAIDARRNIPIALLAPILSVSGCSLFNLQKDTDSARAAMPKLSLSGVAAGRSTAGGIRDYSAEWHDFSDTAAFVANLDLVISVDTAVAHLAGALGKPVWLLNRYDTCWRWLLDRSDSPWYSTLRQFRQPSLGEWQPVVAAAAAALDAAVAADAGYNPFGNT